MQALAKNLLARAALTFATTPNTLPHTTWWPSTPTATTYTHKVTDTIPTVPTGTGTAAKAAFERPQDTIIILIPKLTAAGQPSLPYAPRKDQQFLAGHATTSTDPAVKKYLITKVTSAAIAAHYTLECICS